MAPWVPFVQTLKLACLVRLHVCLVCQHNTNMIAELSDAANVGSLGAPSLATVSEGAFYATDGEFHTTQVCIRPKVKPVVPRQPPVAPAARRLREQLYGELLPIEPTASRARGPAASRAVLWGAAPKSQSQDPGMQPNHHGRHSTNDKLTPPAAYGGKRRKTGSYARFAGAHASTGGGGGGGS